MFEQPAKKDIDAALSILMHEARRQVQDAKNRVTSDAIKSGADIVNVTASHQSLAQRSRTQVATMPRERATRPARRSVFVCKLRE